MRMHVKSLSILVLFGTVVGCSIVKKPGRKGKGNHDVEKSADPKDGSISEDEFRKISSTMSYPTDGYKKKTSKQADGRVKSTEEKSTVKVSDLVEKEIIHTKEFTYNPDKVTEEYEVTVTEKDNEDNRISEKQYSDLENKKLVSETTYTYHDMKRGNRKTTVEKEYNASGTMISMETEEISEDGLTRRVTKKDLVANVETVTDIVCGKWENGSQTCESKSGGKLVGKTITAPLTNSTITYNDTYPNGVETNFYRYSEDPLVKNLTAESRQFYLGSYPSKNSSKCEFTTENASCKATSSDDKDKLSSKEESTYKLKKFVVRASDYVDGKRTETRKDMYLATEISEKTERYMYKDGKVTGTSDVSKEYNDDLLATKKTENGTDMNFSTSKVEKTPEEVTSYTYDDKKRLVKESTSGVTGSSTAEITYEY